LSPPADPADPADPKDAPELGAAEARRLRAKARVGMIILGARTVVLQLLLLGANVVIARLLDPADFGLFAIVQFALAFFTFFGDAGLGGALIQQRREPSQRELSTVFWAQLAITALVVGVVWASADLIRVVWPTVPPSAPLLLRVLSIDLVLTGVRVLPSILMERHLEFGRLSVLDLVGTLAFHAAVIALALLGLGTWALIASVLVQGTVVAMLAFALRPWRPSLELDRRALGPLLRFGIPFQLKGAVSFFNGAVTPLYAGSMLGQERLGQVSFAQTTAWFPLRLVEIVGRVSFPLYSRLRDDPRQMADSLAKNVQICAVGTLFFSGLVFGIGPSIVDVIYGAKWLPSVPLLYVFSLAICVGFVSPIVGPAFDALGKPQIFARLTVMWTVVNWLAVLSTTPVWPERYRMLGFVVAYCMHVLVGNVAVLVVLRRVVGKTGLVRRVAPPALGGLAVAALGRFVLLPRVHGVPSFVLAVLASLVLFALVLWVLDRNAVRTSVEFLRRRG
jgi:PST family polysaccharide transporter